jgi:succinate dehydrogenase flavin-adding protein (antitoxin of CptAB toxin-antitoxin module)
MQELDILLTRYLRERWSRADAQERAAFERLLELPDPQLADYLFERDRPDDAGLVRLLSLLRRP